MLNLISLKNLSKREIEIILNRAEQIRLGINTYRTSIDNVFAANLFFEPSTRTRFSFEVAQKRLGLQVLNFAEEVSSVKKGETYYDTLKTLESMGVEIAVVRWKEEGLLEKLQPHLEISLINAGEGSKEHPTQALLDMLTIKQEFGTLENKTIAIIGDIKHSRVAHSHLEVLPRMGAKVITSGPDYLMDSTNFPYVSVDEAVRTADVVMMLRVQRERHQGISWETDEYLQKYGLTENRVNMMKKGSIIMHPAPFNRGVEIESSVIESNRSRIFKQVANGVLVRMAVMENILQRRGHVEKKLLLGVER